MWAHTKLFIVGDADEINGNAFKFVKMNEGWRFTISNSGIYRY